jgi:aspartate/methionine/tyrosine aminotransferase
MTAHPPRLNSSNRMEAVQTPIIPVIGELIRNNPGTISLGQGVVYYGPPESAFSQIPSFLADCANHKYKLAQGIPPLLELLEAKLRIENQIDLGTGSGCMVTAGGNQAFFNAILAITDPGDEVILLVPYYFNHEMAVVMAGCRPVLVRTDENYQLRPEAIQAAITSRTRAVVTISPNNPTGAVYPEPALRTVNRICREAGVYHINDEAYEYFLYGGARHFSPGSIPGSAAHTISLFSLSKAYGFASWRIGYMVFPEALLAPMKKIQDTIVICPPVVSQFAAVGALQAGSRYCRERLQTIEESRRIFLQALAALKPICTVPETFGAFYFLLRLDTGRNPVDLARELIESHKVAVIPGTAFGLHDGCHLRVAYGALEPAAAAEGIGRLVQGLQQSL